MKKTTIALLLIVLMVLMTACVTTPKPEASVEQTSSTTEPIKVETETAEVKTDFPKDNITMIIPQGIGGGSDLIARCLASEVEKTLGVSVICQNLEGGSTSIGLQSLFDSNPDGYTICMSMTNLSMLSTQGISELTYNDFESICAVNYDAASIMIRTNDDRFNDIDSFIAYAKAHPGELNWGTGAAGGMWHLAILSFCNAAGIQVNIVPNSGGGTGVGLALTNGDIDAAVFSPVDTMAYIVSNDIKPIVSMTEDRMASFPDVPTAIECGYDVITLSTRGFLAPKGTPAEVIDILESAFKQAVESESFKTFIENMASNILWLSSEEYETYMQGEVDRYVPILLSSGIVKN